MAVLSLRLLYFLDLAGLLVGFQLLLGQLRVGDVPLWALKMIIFSRKSYEQREGYIECNREREREEKEVDR